MKKALLIGLTLVLLLGVGVLAHRRLVMDEPDDLGMRSGRLAPCPESPNCVSSYANDEGHRVEPLRLEREAADALAALRSLIEAMPRARIVESSDSYLRAEYTTLIWRYVDDLEILIDAEAGKIHLRSASRTGYSDLGLNRRRVEELVAAWGASAAD